MKELYHDKTVNWARRANDLSHVCRFIGVNINFSYISPLPDYRKSPVDFLIRFRVISPIELSAYQTPRFHQSFTRSVCFSRLTWSLIHRIYCSWPSGREHRTCIRVRPHKEGLAWKRSEVYLIRRGKKNCSSETRTSSLTQSADKETLAYKTKPAFGPVWVRLKPAPV